jgi:predicted membrane chloride channel (bestrophin family)
VPRFFYAHALRFVSLWTFTLPFALLNTFPSTKTLVVAMGLVTWALFGLRELGVKAQYPFSWGAVDLKRLWREVLWDARLILEGGEQAAKAAVQADADKETEQEREDAAAAQ